MSQRSQQLTQAISQFNTGSGPDRLTAIFNTLSKRALGHKHLDQATAAFEEMIGAAREILSCRLTDSAEKNPRLSLADRSVSLHLVYMGASHADTDNLTPISMRAIVSPTSFIMCSRRLPLALYSGYTEFRHIKRTSQVLNYGSDDFRLATAFSLLLCHTFEGLVREESNFVPCVIPHSKGLFLGTVKRESGPQAIETWFASYTPPPGKIISTHVREAGMEFSASVQLNTFVDVGMLSNPQHELRDQLLEPFKSDAVRTKLAFAVDMYNIGPFAITNNHHMRNGWNKDYKELIDVMRSPLWRRESQRALENLRRAEFH